jgi:hypothetical protein
VRFVALSSPDGYSEIDLDAASVTQYSTEMTDEAMFVIVAVSTCVQTMYYYWIR